MALKLIGQFSGECIDCHTNIKFINSDWLIESTYCSLLRVHLTVSVPEIRRPRRDSQT